MINKQKKLITFEMRADLYKKIHRIIESVTERCGFIFSEDGLSIITVDPANIAMGSVTIKKNSFVEYDLTKGQPNPLKIGFDLDKLEEIGLLEDCSENNIRFTIFECKGEGKFNGTKTMCNVHYDIFNNTLELPSINEVTVPEKIRSYKNTCSFTIDKQTFGKVSSNKRGGDVQIVCDQNLINFTGESLSSTWVTDKIQVNDTGEAHSKYSSAYLRDFIGAIPDETPITVSYITDYPCEIKIEFAEGCAATWILAPRLERD